MWKRTRGAHLRRDLNSCICCCTPGRQRRRQRQGGGGEAEAREVVREGHHTGPQLLRPCIESRNKVSICEDGCVDLSSLKFMLVPVKNHT